MPFGLLTRTVLVNPNRYGKDAAKLIRMTGTLEGKLYRIPLKLYEAARQGRCCRVGEVPADYDPKRDKDKGRCCS